ncbi:acyltransferase family domain-containing protein [Phthorimaea operculella]|nr:acyltransferase family domain-containing protein [Phthorimaea operculella]
MAWNKVAIVFVIISASLATANSVFDQQLYEDVLDPGLCQQQLVLLMNNSLRNQFFDASFRIPSGILTGNVNDLGDYHQCLRIDQQVESQQIQGKYCAITVPLQQQNPIQWPNFPEWNITIPDLNGTFPNITWPEIPEAVNPEDDQTMKLLQLKLWAQAFAGIHQNPEPLGAQQPRIFPMLITATQGATLAVCIPKVCSPRQALNFVQEMSGILNITFNEYFCRLPNDKPFTTVDYVAIAIFSFIGLLIGMSTAYDLVQVFHYKRDASRISPLYRSFSLYTNTRRFLTFKSSPGALECVDGIRAISMLWVVVGHTYSFTLLRFIHNMFDIYEWMTDISSTWINAAPITVDTFFMLSGVLVVYTTIGKISRARFIRAIPMFYLNRLLRMFPLLAAMILFQASLINHLADGPFWLNVSSISENCRQYWWSTLLHVQNYVNPYSICLQQTWYLSVDMQLYFVAPLVLLFLWAKPLGAWSALVFALLLSLVSSSLFSFLYDFSAALANFSRIIEFNDYVKLYYVNTLARAPPFFVGMVYGYLLVVFRDKKIRISRFNNIILWLLSLLMMAFCIFSMYPVMQPDHTAQQFDNFLNAYMRAIWAAALGWVIFACVKGYGGPINWFLSLTMWKLPARLSYAVYLVHVTIILANGGTAVKTHYFTPMEAFYRFASDATFAFIAAFILCICIDAPCSTLQKLLLGGGGQRKPQKPTQPEARNGNVAEFETGNVIKTAL